MPRFGGLWRLNDKCTDLTLRCNGEDFQIHRLLVCHQSPVLAAAMGGKFREAQSGIIELPEDDLDTVKRALSFLYDGDYEGATLPETSTTPSETPEPSLVQALEDPSPQEEGGRTGLASRAAPRRESQAAEEESQAAEEMSNVLASPRLDLASHIEVYAFADRYDIPGLKILAAAKFNTSLKVGSPWKHSSFRNIVQQVYQCTPVSDKILKQTIALTCRNHIAYLLSDANFGLVVRDLDGVGLDILQEVITQHLQEVQELK
ncbi:MAG: hypothetical protein M1812_002839 [Candelaria pacifica]|nr:MAG: hypothetical protein M1812_002839 [Candelaria pacifica]